MTELSQCFDKKRLTYHLVEDLKSTCVFATERDATILGIGESIVSLDSTVDGIRQTLRYPSRKSLEPKKYYVNRCWRCFLATHSTFLLTKEMCIISSLSNARLDLFLCF